MEKLSCIIIDDEIEALDRLEGLLQKFDFIKIIDKIDNPVYAESQIKELQPDIVFVDVEMPKVNGFDIVKDVKKKNCEITFIFVTGYNQYAIKAIRAEAFDFLIKPIDIDELKDTLERFCEKKEAKNINELPEKLIKEFSLTPREVEMVELIAQHKTSKEIAESLFISKNTVNTHRRNILEKTEKKSIMELLTFLSIHR